MCHILFDKVIKYHLIINSLCVNLSSGDELLLTEMIFNGLFNDLTVEQATALLSCFVFQENVRTKRTQTHLIPLNSLHKQIFKPLSNAEISS